MSIHRNLTALRALSHLLRTTLLSVTILSLAVGAVRAHPGGVDEEGCHTEARSGQRHCHNRSIVDPSRSVRVGDEGVFFGPLVAVTDGDTFNVKVQGVVMEFRLAGIDAPESDQPYGRESKAQLRDLIGESMCVLVPIDTDRYGRTVAFLWIDDRSVNRAMVERGAAWFYSEFAADASLYEVEQQARKLKRGLWALPTQARVEPWVWRRRSR